MKIIHRLSSGYPQTLARVNSRKIFAALLKAVLESGFAEPGV